MAGGDTQEVVRAWRRRCYDVRIEIPRGEKVAQYLLGANGIRGGVSFQGANVLDQMKSVGIFDSGSVQLQRDRNSISKCAQTY